MWSRYKPFLIVESLDPHQQPQIDYHNSQIDDSKSSELWTISLVINDVHVNVSDTLTMFEKQVV